MATLSNFGIPGAGTGILHPRLKNKFRITFLNMGALVPGTNSRNLTMQVTNITLPNITFEEVVLHRYNSTAYVAGKHSWEPISVTVEDDITGLAATVVKAQLETQGRIIGSDLDGRWLNCMITGSDFGDRDYSASEAATITMQLRFDHARHIEVGTGYGTAIGGNVA